MAEYKKAINWSHPYEGQAPEECMSESLPVMTGHDDQIESGSGQGYPSTFSTPFMNLQKPLETYQEPHNHPGDDVIDSGNPY